MAERNAIMKSDIRGSHLVVPGLRELLDASPDLLFACDADGGLLWLSRVFETLTGRVAAEQIGRHWSTLVAPHEARRVMRVFLRQRRRRTPLVEVALSLIASEERETPVAVRVSLLHRADGGVIFVGTARAVECEAAAVVTAPRPTADTMLVETNACAPVTAEPTGPGLAVEGDSGLLATLTHELHAPLNGMMGMAHLLLETELDRDQRSLAEVLLHAGESLLERVNDTLAFSRAGAGELELERLPFDLRVTANEAAALLAPLANEKRLHFTCEVDQEVPSRLWGDPGRLRQVLVNLGGNAIQFTQRGRVRLVVKRVREDEREATLRFEFQDTGIGMTEGQRDRIVQALEQADASSMRHCGGKGLGLAISSQLVSLMGGTVEVESAPGQGSTFRFDLTLEKQCAAAPAPQAATTHLGLAGLRVMVVDPSPASQRACLGSLKGWGCRVESAENAEVGLVMLQEAAAAGDPFRFAVIERQLPGMDGEEMGVAIRADGACDRTLTVLVTSAGRRGDADRARARGFSVYLSKPLDWESLAAALAEALRRAEGAAAGAMPELVTLHTMAVAQRGSLRILLVEDSAVNQLVTQWALKRLGYGLQIAPTARAALESWKRERFDLVLMDIQLPDGDGYALTRELRSSEPTGGRVPIVAMTGSNEAGGREKCLAAGMDEFIPKPVDLGLLCRVVRSLTGGETAVDARASLAVRPRDVADPGKVALAMDDRPLLRELGAAEQEISAAQRPPGPSPALTSLSSADVMPLDGDPLHDGLATDTPRPALDVARLEELSRGLPEMRDSLLGTFLNDVRPRLERLALAVNGHDTRRVEFEAHGLKGMCATVGAIACAELFAELERLGRGQTLDLAPPLLKRAHLEVTRTERYITAMERRAA